MPAPPSSQSPAHQLTRFVQVVPHQRALGMYFVSLEGGRGTLGLPYAERWVGNPETGVLHGGAVTALMDTTAGMAVFVALGGTHRIATLELRLDYLRPATPGQPVHASAECLKVTRNVAFVRCEAFHPDEPTERIALATGTFMIFRSEPTHVPAGGSKPRVMPEMPRSSAGTQEDAPKSPSAHASEAVPADAPESLSADAPEAVSADAARATPAEDRAPSLLERIERAKRRGGRADLAGLVPYMVSLGIEFSSELIEGEQELTATMRFAEHLIGNPALPALHGGTLGGLLETTAIVEALWRAESVVIPKIVSITVDYLRTGRPRDTHARARIVKRGRRVLSVHVEAWQDDPKRPVATAHVHLLVIGKE